MKNSFLLLIFLLAGLLFESCSKTGTLQDNSSISFTANDSSVIFPVAKVFIEDVLNLKTTAVVGQYADTSNNPGNISIRVLSDTTGRFSGDSLLVSYTNSYGTVFNNINDSSSYVEIDKFPKTASGTVTGSFSIIVANANDTLKLLRGIFTANYQN